MKKFWIVFIIIAVLIGGSLGILWRLMRSLDTGPDIAGGVLVWQVAQPYAEERDDSLVGLLVEGHYPIMRDIVFSLKRAAEDEDIHGLLLQIQALPADWAKVEELRQAVLAFSAAGKPVVAYLEGAGTKEYALAMAADSIVLAPEAHLMVLGISAELSFIKTTLGKLGIKADFVHVGRYKSAPEALTREEPSAPYREMMEAIVEERYRRLIDMITTSRGVTSEQAEIWIDAGIYDAPSAFAAGLVDTILCKDEVLESLFEGDKHTDLHDYLLKRKRGHAAARIALIYATGTIAPGETRHDNLHGKVAGSETVIKHLRSARKDDGIDAVVLRVDSPGGSALASDLIWNEVQRLQQEKPVIVSMSGYAASGGYYISCGADSIFAEPGTLTGSIGVFAGKMDMAGFYDKIGVQREFITRGENALLFGNNALFTKAQRQRLTGLLEDFYERFLAKVAEGRGLELTQVAAIAEGRVWTGSQAQQNKLVDGLGGMDRALDSAKYMVGLQPSEKVALVSYERQLTFIERLLLRSLHDATRGAELSFPAFSILSDLGLEDDFAAVPFLDGKPVAMLPFRVQFR